METVEAERNSPRPKGPSLIGGAFSRPVMSVAPTSVQIRQLSKPPESEAGLDLDGYLDWVQGRRIDPPGHTSFTSGADYWQTVASPNLDQFSNIVQNVPVTSFRHSSAPQSIEYWGDPCAPRNNQCFYNPLSSPPYFRLSPSTYLSPPAHQQANPPRYFQGTGFQVQAQASPDWHAPKPLVKPEDICPPAIDQDTRRTLPTHFDAKPNQNCPWDIKTIKDNINKLANDLKWDPLPNPSFQPGSLVPKETFRELRPSVCSRCLHMPPFFATLYIAECSHILCFLCIYKRLIEALAMDEANFRPAFCCDPTLCFRNEIYAVVLQPGELLHYHKRHIRYIYQNTEFCLNRPSCQYGPSRSLRVLGRGAMACLNPQCSAIMCTRCGGRYGTGRETVTRGPGMNGIIYGNCQLCTTSFQIEPGHTINGKRCKDRQACMMTGKNSQLCTCDKSWSEAQAYGNFKTTPLHPTCRHLDPTEMYGHSDLFSYLLDPNVETQARKNVFNFNWAEPVYLLNLNKYWIDTTRKAKIIYDLWIRAQTIVQSSEEIKSAQLERASRASLRGCKPRPPIGCFEKGSTKPTVVAAIPNLVRSYVAAPNGRISHRGAILGARSFAPSLPRTFPFLPAPVPPALPALNNHVHSYQDSGEVIDLPETQNANISHHENFTSLSNSMIGNSASDETLQSMVAQEPAPALTSPPQSFSQETQEADFSATTPPSSQETSQRV